MSAVTVHSDFGAQENKVCHCSHFSPIYLSWSDGTRCQDLHFWTLSFKPSFSLSSFNFIKRLFSSSLSAIRVVSSVYLKLSCLSRVWLFAIPWTVAYQALLPMEFSRQEYWSGLPLICRWHNPSSRKWRGLKSFLINVKEESEKAGLKLNIQKTKIMAASPITSWQKMGKQWKQWQTLFSWAPKSLQRGTAAMKLKDACSLEENLWQT